MEKRTWAKLVLLLIVVVGLAVGIGVRWRAIAGGSDPPAGWGRGTPGVAERSYYTGRINRLIEKWKETGQQASRDRDGRYEDSYRTVLVIDPNEGAIWIEDGGVVRKNSRIELPGGTNWEVHHITPEGDEKLAGRIVLKMRGAYTSQHRPERFHLISEQQGAGHFDFQFTATGGRGGYESGTFSPQPVRSRSTDGSRTLYGSMLVTADEYENYRSIDANAAAMPGSMFEENEAAWLKVERHLYARIERQVQREGCELRTLEIEAGPDFSAGHARIRARNDSFLRGLFGGPSSIDAYLKIDYLGKGVWYLNSAPHPRRPQLPAMRRRMVDLEFLVHPGSEIDDARRNELLARGRAIQEAAAEAIRSNWRAELPSGATVELIGICENPSAGKRWWGPDGSPLDCVPYINTQPYGRDREDRKIYEIAYRIKPGSNGSSMRSGFEGCVGSYGRSITDRYGLRIMQGLSGSGYGFDKSRRKTNWNVSLSAGQWKTALTVKDEIGELKFLERQRIVLNPPEIEDGEIVVRCFEESATRTSDYETDFAAIVWEGGERKTVSLNRYEEDVTDHRDTGLCEHKYIIDGMSMSQLEGVCFRYRPYESVTFKNISLVPGEDFGFEIEIGP